MGHTILPKRVIMYEKLAQWEKFCKSLRQPYRERLLHLVHATYSHISGMVYTNALDDDEVIVYGMLASLALEKDYGVQENVRRCLAILLSKELP